MHPPLELTRRGMGPGQETQSGKKALERPYRRPSPEPRLVRAPEGPGGERRGSTSAHTRKGQAART